MGVLRRPTSNGTRALREFKPKDDAAVLKPLLAQGAIVMGKTNLHELSYSWTSNDESFGAVRNLIRSTSQAAAVLARQPRLAQNVAFPAGTMVQ
jgi:Asp-tRNA(Asn)/Glu-tRNA(Gln) amidotransferase A subunit family amidase